VGTLNEVREDLGLKPYTKFEQITSDKSTVAALKEAYHGQVDQVDFWVGGISENHVKGGLFGQTFRTVLEDQFTRLRDGDRFYFENSEVSGLDKKEIKDIQKQTFADILERNSDAEVQKDAFKAAELPDQKGGSAHHKAEPAQEHGPAEQGQEHAPEHAPAEQPAAAAVEALAPPKAEPAAAPASALSALVASALVDDGGPMDFSAMAAHTPEPAPLPVPEVAEMNPLAMMIDPHHHGLLAA